MTLVIRRSLSLPYYILKGTVDPVIRRALARTLTYVPRDIPRKSVRDAKVQTGTDIFEETLLCRAKTGEWYFPTGMLTRVLEVLDSIEYDYRVENDVELPGDPIGLEWKTDKVLYDYQREAAEIAYVNNGGTICLPTGAGKTLVCLRLIYAFDHRTLVLVHTRELMKQWRNAIQQTFGIDPGMVGGSFKENWDDVTIASVQTIASRLKRGKLSEIDMNYPVLVADECLPYGAPVVTNFGILPIGEIVEQRLPVNVLTHTGKYQRVTAYQKIPLAKRLVRVTHSCGSFVCTEDHKINTQRGWIEAANLTDGDVVYILTEAWGERNGVCVRDLLNGRYLIEHDRDLGPDARGTPENTFRPSDVWTVDVIDSGGMSHVYDVTVEEDHSFVASGCQHSNCHHMPAADTYSVAMVYNSPVRIGLSATPMRVDGRELKIFGAIGDICARITPVDLIRRGYLTEPRFVILDPPYIKMRKVKSWQDAYYDGIVANQYRNQMIVETARELMEAGHKVYVHVERIEHGDILSTMFGDIPFIHGSTPKKTRDETIAKFAGDELNCLVSTLLGEGVDIPTMTAIIMAGGLKTPVGVVQKVGRALRKSPGKEEAIIVDFRDKGPWLSQHFQERMDVYRETYGEYVERR